jgi:fatty-acyl-CoA synthase
MVGTFAWNLDLMWSYTMGYPGIGAVCHTINIRLSSNQIEYIINNSEDKVILLLMRH